MLKHVLPLIILTFLLSAATWKITEQTSTRIVMELVSEEPIPIPEPTPEPIPIPDPPPVVGDETAWLMGYYVGYQQGLYPPEKVDFTSITHLMVGRAVPRSDGTLTTNLDIDDTNGPILAKKLASLAKANGRKSILMLGGDGARNGWIGAASATNRSKFIANLLKLVDEWGYDGLDLDWEPILAEDKPLLLALTKELRAARPNIILTIPVGWVNANFSADAWFKEIAPYVDRINVMSYLMGGAWDGWLSWHSTALEGHGGRYPSSLDASAKGYMAVGIPATKLGLGIGFFGVCWKGITGPRQETSGASIVASDNTMSYRNIISSYFVESGYKWDDAAGVPYLSYPNGHGSLGCQFISSEDPRSAQLKGEYVRTNGLGGMIVWTVNQGYIPELDQNPLLTALAKGMFSESAPAPLPEPEPEPEPTPPPPAPSSEIQGSISGSLPKAVYSVTGDLHVAKGTTLTIAPGTTLMFKGPYKMTVDGILISKGTDAERIVFTAENKSEGWKGLRWESNNHDTSPTNIIAYTRFEYGNKMQKIVNGSYKENRAGALFVYGVENISLENNEFYYNKANDKCGAVMLLSIDAAISFTNNVFVGNESGNYGGAICFTHGRYQKVYGGRFEGNKATQYGGIYVYDTQITLYGVEFSGNVPNNGGGNIKIGQ